ncbi:MAG: tRNA 2-thiouridine(34) synthase MnmA [Candidatus Hydrothermae bacterium]|nr:tRNA 2-thiouridine(34) synthase MnmA [Candidatus Hydrothermae bacterium]
MALKVLVLMSGGVDSSVAAAILREQGCNVAGLTFNLLGYGIASKDIDDAKEVTSRLGIKHAVSDLSSYFHKTIVKYFLDEYKFGRTPNPCVFCNKIIKVKMGLQLADEMGFDYIATGHYARILRDEEGLHLMKAKWQEKSQEYYLSLVESSDLERLMLPLGEFSKDEVRRIARKMGFNISTKEESQEICFVKKDYREFLKSNGFNEMSGKIKDSSGNVLGNHPGYYFYTVGQRRGLGVATGRKLYVKEIRPKENEIIVADIRDLYGYRFFVERPNFFEDVGEEFNATVRVRYRGDETEAFVKREGEVYKVELKERLFAITPGQIAVFYNGDKVLGGGVISDFSS